jgi:hypothetical protein
MTPMRPSMKGREDTRKKGQSGDTDRNEEEAAPG